MFKEPSRCPLLADPLLNGDFPIRGLHQAVAVAAMCLQEEAHIRPLISDVVTALSFLGNGPDASTDASSFPSPESDKKPAFSNEENYDEDSKTERQRAVAEAIEWGSTSRHTQSQTHSGML